MALDLSAASIIRAGSGLLLLAFGLAMAVLLRRGVEQRKLALGLALHGVGSGVAFIVVNVAGEDDALAPAAILINAAGWLIADVGLLLILLWSGVRGAWRAALVAMIVVLTLGSAAIALSVDTTTLTTELTSWAPSAFPFFPLDYFAYYIGWVLALLVAAALATRHHEQPTERRAVVLLALGIVAYPALTRGNGLLDEGVSRYEIVGEAIAITAILILAIAWIKETETSPKSARLVAPVALACWLVGMITALDASLDPSSVVGFVRIAGVVAVAIAVLRHDLLRSRLATGSAKRGTVATGALAALFIVAQIAQNYLSSSYGLLMGGVVAGAFLFAASPIQRALERLSGTQGQGEEPSATRAEALYRANLRLVLKDERVTAEEEIHLAELGERLGISARRAVELRHDVEREKGAR